MDTRKLQYFMLVVEFGSINRAAKEIGLTQPALSRCLSELERDLGRSLLLRRRSGIALTDEGLLLAARAPDLLRHEAEVRQGIAEEFAARVVIGMPTPLRNPITIPLVQEMRKAMPRTKIRIFEGFNIYIRDLLRQGLLDVAILPDNLVPAADFDQVPLAREPILLFRKTALPQLPRPAPIAELVKYPLAMPGRPNAVRTIVETALKAARLPMPDVVLEPENMEIAHLLVRSGCVEQCAGIGQVFPDEGRAGMWIAELEGLDLRWVLAVNRQRSHMIAVRQLRRLATMIATRALEQKSWYGARAA